MSYIVTAVISGLVFFILGALLGMWLASPDEADEWDEEWDEDEVPDYIVEVDGDPVVWLEEKK